MSRSGPGLIRRVVAWISTVAVVAVIPVIAGAPSAQAAGSINTAASASDIATAIDSTGPTSAITGASFVTRPPSGTPDATSNEPLAAFPTDGSSYGILTTGNASLADTPNSSGSSGADDNGAAFHGNSAFDVTDLKVNLTVPPGFSCLRFDFRFLSEEFPEYVGSNYNDAFIAELDNNTWTANGSTINAPNDFAFDPSSSPGNAIPISINSTGFAHMSAAEAAGTTYDGATPLLSAQTPITSGPHSIYLSIFDQGDRVYDSAAFVDNLSLGTQSGANCQKGAQPLSNLTLAASPSSVPAGFSAIPEASLNYGALSAPGAGANALGTSPIPHSPIPHSPIPHSPIPHSPIPHSPIPHSAIIDGDSSYATALLSALPLADPNLPDIPIASVPIASPPGPWPNVLTPALAAQPFEAVTLQEVAASANADHVRIGDLDLTGTAIGNLSPASLLFSNATLAQLGLPSIGGIATSGRLADVELAGGSLASSGGAISGVTLSDKAGVLSSSLISYALLNGITFGDSPAWNIPVSSLPNPDAVIDPACSCSGLTLGQAQQQGGFVSTATLGDLLSSNGSAFTGKTFGQLLAAMISPANFPFHSVPLNQITGAAGIDASNLVTYTASADVPCPFNSVSAQVTLPGHGFRFDGDTSGPNAATVKYGNAAAAPTAPSNQSGNDLTWNLTDPNSCASGTEHVVITVKAEPGPNLGTFPASLHVTAGGQTLSVLDQAAVTTTENFEPNNDPTSAAPIQRDTLYLDTLKPGPTPDTDYFNLPVTPADVGGTVQIGLSHMSGLDGDLVLYGTDNGSSLRSAPIPHSPIPHSPIPHSPLTDDGACGPPGTVLEPQTLQDVPQLNTAGYAIRSYSTNRGTTNEFSCAVIQPQDVGHGITVQVSGYGGTGSNVPMVLSATVTAPQAAPPCVAVPAATGTPGPALPAPADLASTTQTLFLVNEQAIGKFYGDAAETSVATALSNPAFLNMPHVRGAVLSVEGNSAVADAYSAWYAQYCSPDKANDVVRAINNLVDSYRNSLPNLKNVVLVGSDAVLPFGRVPELVNLGSEAAQAPYEQFNGNDNPTARALALGYILSDDPYYSFQPVPWLTSQVYPPSVAGGRLVETPADIVNAITKYVTFAGVLDPTTEFTTGYSFFGDGAASEEAFLHAHYGYAQSASLTSYPSQINETWTKTNVVDALNASPGILALNGHADPSRLEPAAAFHDSAPASTDLFNTADFIGTAVADGTLAFSIGCHFGLSVPDVWISGSAPPEALDWAQAFAQKSSLLDANTGFGYGDTSTIAYSEKINALLAKNLDGSMSIGQAIAYAKQQYYASLGAWGVFDAKAVEEFTPYGLPMYTVGLTGVVAGPLEMAASGSVSTDPDTGLPSTTVTLNGALNSGSVNTGHGVYYKGPNGDVSAEQNRPIEPVTAPQDVTPPAGTGALHGAVILSFNNDDHHPFTPAYSVPTIGAIDPSVTPSFSDATFPSWYVSTLSQDTVLGHRDSLVVYGGQFVADPGSVNTGTQRLLSDATVRAYFSTSTDFSSIEFTNVDATDNGSTANVRVSTPSPSSEIAAMYVTYRSATTNHFQSQLMSFGSGLWSTDIDTSSHKVAEYFIQAVSTSGNVSVSSFKGLGYPAPQPPPASGGTPVISVKNAGGNFVTPSDNGVYHQSPLTVNVTQGTETFTGQITKDSGPAGPAGQPVPVTVGDGSGGVGGGDGNYTIVFTGDQGDTAHTNINIDTHAPTITVTHTANGPNGWNTTPAVTVNVVASDGGSGLASVTCTVNGNPAALSPASASGSSYSGTLSVTGDGTHPVSCTAKDLADNSSSSSDTVMIDTQAPTITVTHTPNGSNGWNTTSSVTVSVGASDSGSGLGSITCVDGSTPLTLTPSPSGGSSYSGSVSVTGEGPHTVTCTATDQVGHSNSGSDAAIKIDSVKPTITITTPADGATYNDGQTVAASYSCSDGSGSGIVPSTGCTGTVANGSNINTSAGSHSFTVNATDNAGNTSTKTVTYKATGPIAFTSGRTGNGDIYTVKVDGSGLTNLTPGSNAIDADPVWKPGHSKLAFVSTRDGSSKIYIMNGDGSGTPTRLTTDPKKVTELTPVWSPDGSKIAFSTDRDGNFEIYVINANGTGLTRITNNKADDLSPTWSPDGSKLAFSTNRDGNWEIYSVMTSAPFTTYRLTSTTNKISDITPAWSPNAQRILFSTDRDGNFEIYAMNVNPAGTAVVGTPTRLTNNSAIDATPAWSPDGAKIVFSSSRSGNGDIYIMNADGTSPQVLAPSSAIDTLPSW